MTTNSVLPKYIIEDLSQGSDEWLAWRDTKITATDSAIILDQSPHKTRYVLWGQKKGLIEPDDLENNPHVKRGNEAEDKIRQQVEETIDDLLFPNCVTSTEYPLFSASLDGIDSGGIPHEFKAPCETMYNDILLRGRGSDAFKLYSIQVQHQIMVTDAPRGMLHFGYQPKPGVPFEIVTFNIDRDDALIAEMIKAGTEFHALLTSDTPPAKDEARDDFNPTGTDADEWRQNAREYRDIQKRVDELKAALEPLEARQKEIQRSCSSIMGKFKSGESHGLRITRVERSGSTNYASAFYEWTKGEDTKQVKDFLGSYKGKSSHYLRAFVDVDFVDEIVPVAFVPEAKPSAKPSDIPEVKPSVKPSEIPEVTPSVKPSEDLFQANACYDNGLDFGDHDWI